MPVDGFFEQGELSAELVELAEASLALGDADAAFLLLAQVHENHRHNRWTATRVEALHLQGNYEGCRELAAPALNEMIAQQDWLNATRVLLAHCRSMDALGNVHAGIEFLHRIEIQLRTLTERGAEFRANVQLNLAGGICAQGDVETAHQLTIATVSICAQSQDWRLHANYLWVQAQISEAAGDLPAAIDLVDKVVGVFDFHGDVSAMSRAVSHLCWLVTMYIDVGHDDLLRAHVWLEKVLRLERGAESSSVGWYLKAYEAHLMILLGDRERALMRLGALGALQSRDESANSWIQWIFALCEFEMGNQEQALVHLDNAMDLGMQFVDGTGRRVLRRYAHLYMDLNQPNKCNEYLEMLFEEKTLDYSWCLP